MNEVAWTTLLLITAGIAVLVVSLTRMAGLLLLLKKTPFRKRWKILTGFITLFILFFVLSSFLIIKGSVQFFQFQIGVLFLLGSFFVLMVINITRKTISDLVESSETGSMLHNILKAVPFSIIVTDKNGNITSVNNAALALSGYSENEFTGKRIEDLLAISPGVRVIQADSILSGKSGKEIPVLVSTAELPQLPGSEQAFIYHLQDISALNEAQKDLLLSERKYKALITNAVDVLYTCDYKGNFTFLSPALKKLCGYSAEELIGQHYSVLIPDDWKQRVMDFYKQQFLSRTNETLFDFPIQTRDGKIKWVEQTVVLLQKDNWVTGFECIVRDITERKQAAEKIRSLIQEVEKNKFQALRENEIRERMGRFINYQSALLNISRTETSSLNETFKKITEYDSRAIMVERVSIWIFSTDRSSLVCEDLFQKSESSHRPGPTLHSADYPEYFRALNARRTIAAEDALTDPSTSEFAEGYLKPLNIGSLLDVPVRLHGRVIGVVCHEHVGGPRKWTPEEEAFASSVADMVALSIESASRKKAELEAMKFSELVKNSPDFIAIVSLDGKFSFINDAGKKLLGIEDGDNLTGIRLFQPIEGQSKIQDEEIRSLKEKGYWKGSKTVKNIRTNEEIPVSVISFLMKVNGEAASVATIQRDITQQIKAEKEIKKLNETLEQRVADRTRDLESFSYSVSHDLRAPLRAINGYSKILEEEYAPKMDDEAKRLVKVIMDNSVKMGNLIDDLLTFSRIGRKEEEVSDIPMDELVAEIIREIKTQNPDRNIDFKVGKLGTVRGDLAMIRQVWINLVGNAVKYTRKKEKAEIEIGRKTEEDEVIYFIKDNGVGFDMKYVEKLFGVFQRLHTENEFEGTGVGLAIVKQIITKHNGRVWAEGKENEGAIFYFSLPISKCIV